jgi:hypothetical protein
MGGSILARAWGWRTSWDLNQTPTKAMLQSCGNYTNIRFSDTAPTSHRTGSCKKPSSDLGQDTNDADRGFSVTSRKCHASALNGPLPLPSTTDLRATESFVKSMRTHKRRHWTASQVPAFVRLEPYFFWEIQRSRVRFPALPPYVRSSGSGMGCTQPRDCNWGATWKRK